MEHAGGGNGGQGVTAVRLCADRAQRQHCAAHLAAHQPHGGHLCDATDPARFLRHSPRGIAEPVHRSAQQAARRDGPDPRRATRVTRPRAERDDAPSHG